MTEDEYQAFIGAQAAGSEVYVERCLDKLCTDLGYEADQWRRWKFSDTLARIKNMHVNIKFNNEQFQKRMKAVQEAVAKGQVFIQ